MQKTTTNRKTHTHKMIINDIPWHQDDVLLSKSTKQTKNVANTEKSMIFEPIRIQLDQ